MLDDAIWEKNMLIIDDEKEKSIDNIILMLKLEEAIQLTGAIDDLIENEKIGGKTFHRHINNEEYTKEITISIYSNKSINEFSPLIKDMILNNG
jgi:hypothetical protein